MHSKQWRIDLYLSEDGDVTRARAELHTDHPQPLSAHGAACRAARDPAVPEIGDELAVGRALAALSRELLTLASLDIEESVGDDGPAA